MAKAHRNKKAVAGEAAQPPMVWAEAEQALCDKHNYQYKVLHKYKAII